MLEQLTDLIRNQAGNAIINNNAIPNEKNNEAINLASNSVLSGIQQAISDGKIKDLLSMFSGKQEVTQNAVAQNIQNGFQEQLQNQFGLEQSQASGMASGLIPDVLKNLVHKTNDPNDSQFDLQGIFNKLTGGKSAGLNVQSLMDKFKSGAFDADGDGDTDLQDLMSMLKGGSNEGGGILDKVKNLFK
ncbi:MAG: hypothetical protein JSS67_06095 [Bacteroidetes bacterium]|nr:hypothetical protein [Bacteroidota bacterium]